MEMMVRMFNPKTLQEAYSLVKLQEAVKQDLGGANQGGGRLSYSKAMINTRGFQEAKSGGPMAMGVQEVVNKGLPTYVKKPLNLTSKQIEEKRQKNQYFWCEKKFTLGYRCKNRQLYMITVQDDETEGEGLSREEYKDDPKIQLEKNPQLSIHALEGSYNYQTMRVKGYVKRKSLCILIDWGSTHNFIDVKSNYQIGMCS